MQIKVDGNHGKRKQPQTPKAWNLKNEVKRGKNNKNGIRIRKKKKKAASSLKAPKRLYASNFSVTGTGTKNRMKAVLSICQTTT